MNIACWISSPSSCKMPSCHFYKYRAIYGNLTPRMLCFLSCCAVGSISTAVAVYPPYSILLAVYKTLPWSCSCHCREAWPILHWHSKGFLKTSRIPCVQPWLMWISVAQLRQSHLLYMENVLSNEVQLVWSSLVTSLAMWRIERIRRTIIRITQLWQIWWLAFGHTSVLPRLCMSSSCILWNKLW